MAKDDDKAAAAPDAPKKERVQKPKGDKKKAAEPTGPAPKYKRETAPKLKSLYDKTIRPAMVKEFSYSSVMQVPRILKVTINMGLGIRKPGYNIYVAGIQGTGKTSVIRTFLEKWSADAPAPRDWVYVYDFALGGAKRTMVGLFLHEMGHAHEVAMPGELLEEMAVMHVPIAEANALFGLEFLLDAESRKVYQQLLVTEFAAETYVAYAAAGPALREHIAAQRSARVAAAWRRVYGIFKETFGGAEYE